MNTQTTIPWRRIVVLAQMREQWLAPMTCKVNYGLWKHQRQHQAQRPGKAASTAGLVNKTGAWTEGNLRLQREIVFRWPNPSRESTKGVDGSLSIIPYRICAEQRSGENIEGIICQAAVAGANRALHCARRSLKSTQICNVWARPFLEELQGLCFVPYAQSSCSSRSLWSARVRMGALNPPALCALPQCQSSVCGTVTSALCALLHRAQLPLSLQLLVTNAAGQCTTRAIVQQKRNLGAPRDLSEGDGNFEQPVLLSSNWAQKHHMAGNSPLATLHAEGPFNYFCVPRGLQNALRKHGVGMPIRWPPALLDKVWSHHLASQAEPCPPFSPQVCCSLPWNIY